MSSPLVSVLVPAFNDARYIATALNSIQDQTLGDYEVIISDDASTDATVAIAMEFARGDSRLCVYTNPHNLGMSANWNRALGLAKGKYVFKLDADDALRPCCLEELVNDIESYPRPFVVFCRSLSCNETLGSPAPYLGEEAFRRYGVDPGSRYVLSGSRWYEMSFEDVQIWHSNAQLHNREELLRMGGWNTAWGCAADTDLILRVLEQRRPVCHNPYVGVLYRHRVGSVSDRYRKERLLQWESALVHLMSLSRYGRSGGVYPSRLRAAWRRYWANLGELTNGIPHDEIPQRYRSVLEEVFAVGKPPAYIRFEGKLREIVKKMLG